MTSLQIQKAGVKDGFLIGTPLRPNLPSRSSQDISLYYDPVHRLVVNIIHRVTPHNARITEVKDVKLTNKEFATQSFVTCK